MDFTLLGNIIQFKNGKKKPDSDGLIPVYGGNGIFDHTTKSNYKNCIIIGRVGAYCGSVFYEPNELWVSDNAIAAIPNKETDIQFAYYLLRNIGLNNYRIGTSQPLLTQEILNSITCPNLNYKVQKKISSILVCLDQKIAQNIAINKNLQEQALTLYKKMFVHNISPQWTNGTLSDIADITMGQSPKGDTYNESDDGVVFFQGRGEFSFRFPTRRLFTTDPKRMAQTNDILMSVRAPVGDINVAYEPCCIGRGLAAIRSKDHHQSFLLYLVISLQEKLNMFNGEGTVFGSINRDALNSISIIIPERVSIDQFEEIVSPIDSAIRNNYGEICRLTNIRDTLLPRLMSGELDVSDIDI